MELKITDRILIIDHLLRENKLKKLSKQELLNVLNKRLLDEKLNTISIRQFDNDITTFKKKLGKKLSVKEGLKHIYYYDRKDISINNSVGVKSKDIKLAIDFIKGFRGENILLKTLESEIEKKFNIKSASQTPFHLDSNNIYDKEYSKFIPKIYKAITNSIVLRITYVPRKKRE